MNNTINNNGIKIKYPDRFSEKYNPRLDCRNFGDDNLYPQHINDWYATSPTFNSCANRLSEFLYGEGSQSKLIDNKILKAILLDYAKFGGFALHVQYNGLGDINCVSYVPFETVRLGEQGTNGVYTYCWVCSDWSGQTTINRKKIKPERDKSKYWMFSNDLETRLRRIESGCDGEILYFSNTLSYPVSNANAVINYISAECGLANIIYRDVRSNFTPASVLSVPKQSEDDSNEFANNLVDLQGDENSYKILLFEHSSVDDKPEVLNLQGEDYFPRYTGVITECKDKIISAYHQEAFIRLADGSLGFGSDAISQIYKFYNFSLKTVRNEIETVLRQIEPQFEIKELLFPTDEINVVENV